MQKLVFFDLDGTILGGFSSENVFGFYLLRHGHIRLKQCLMGFFCFLKMLPRFKHHAIIKNKAYLYGLSKERIEDLAAAYVQSHLINKLRPHLIERIEEHRKKGDRLILLTGSPSFLANEFAKYLKMDEVYATKCSHQSGRFTHLLPLQHPYAKEKLHIAQTVCEKHHVDLKNCAAYGNSFNDRFILAAVGQPVAVTPHKSLRILAKKKGWEIIDK